jgi:hypothetical protein
MATPYNIGMKRELFIDDFLTEQRNGDLTFKLHSPTPHAPEPSSPIGGYQTVIKDGDIFRRYYRGHFSNFDGWDSPYPPTEGFVGEFTGYAESKDGIHWKTPRVNRYECPVPNVIRCVSDKTHIGETHNFSPFLDSNPKCKASERFKALGGIFEVGGLFAFYSRDGINFKLYQKEPVVKPEKKFDYAFDSQNSCFYSEAEQQYVLYFRVNLTKDKRKLRTICRAVSKDCIKWSKFQELDVNRENEHLYTNQLHPYCRAKHYYIGPAVRFFENPDKTGTTDITLLFSRAGGPILRPFPGAWIRPGLDPARWGNRSNYVALNIVPTAEDELSLYHERSQVRYTLRPDGFISLNSGLDGGEWQSKVLLYSGGHLEFNVSTAAGGLFVVELQDESGVPLPGFSFAECRKYSGDSLAYAPTWGDKELPLRKNQPFRIHCKLLEADLYSFVFNKEKSIQVEPILVNYKSVLKDGR